MVEWFSRLFGGIRKSFGICHWPDTSRVSQKVFFWWWWWLLWFLLPCRWHPPPPPSDFARADGSLGKRSEEKEHKLDIFSPHPSVRMPSAQKASPHLLVYRKRSFLAWTSTIPGGDVHDPKGIRKTLLENQKKGSLGCPWGKYECRKVQHIPRSAAKHLLGRDPSKLGAPNPLFWRGCPGREHFGTRPFPSPSHFGIRLYTPTSLPPSRRQRFQGSTLM